MTDFDGFMGAYEAKHRRKCIIIVAIALLAAIVSLIRLPFGIYHVGFVEGLEAFFRHLIGDPIDDYVKDTLVWNTMGARAIVTPLIGAALGICGAAMQSTLKNPLADPYMTGISAGASLGISVAAVTGFSILPFISGQQGFIGNAFIFSLIPAAVIVGVTMFRRAPSPASMILIGIAVMYVFRGFSTMLQLMASPSSYSQIYMWSLGDLGALTWDYIPFVTGSLAIGVVILLLMNCQLNAITYDDTVCRSIGVNPKKARIISLVIVSLMTAVAVCFSGTIGFVGLVAPHVMRVFIGSDNKLLLPASAAAGALMLSAADAVALKITATGLPVGVITSLVGGPLFIYLLIKQSKKIWY